jgi:hypothetical protein
MTVADIVHAVAERAELEIGQIDPVPGVGAGQHAQISQDNVSDWEFLSRLADRVGAQIQVLDGKLEFRLPRPPDGAPDPGTRATQHPLVLEANRNLVALRAGVTAAEQVPEVIVRGWDDEQKRPVSATAVPHPAGAEVPTNPVDLARTFASPPYVVGSPGHHTEAEVTAAARALATHLGGAAVEVEGIAKGNPLLRAGVAVALANVGEPFEGRYTLTSTRHLFSQQAGYTTAFTVSGRQERSLYGLAAAGRQAAGSAAHTGLAPAIVSDVRDPLGLGRVRLTFPWLDPDFTSGWARLVQSGAGRGRGAVVLPEVGDEVLAGFAGGDLDRPYVVGSLHSTPDPMPELTVPPVDDASGEVAARGFVSRAGHRLEFTEGNGGVDGVRLATTGDEFMLRLDRAGQLVTLASKGRVTVTAERGVRIDAGTGPLELTGRTVTVQATGGDATVNANGKLALAGTAGATVEGATVAVKGQGAAELTASGSVTVRGGVVRIN